MRWTHGVEVKRKIRKKDGLTMTKTTRNASIQWLRNRRKKLTRPLAPLRYGRRTFVKSVEPKTDSPLATWYLGP